MCLRYDKLFTDIPLALTDSYISMLRTYASDWLDSCWVNDRRKSKCSHQVSSRLTCGLVDWTRYGEATRSLEDVNNAFLVELMQLLDGPSDVSLEIPVDLEAPAHLGAAYASGPFLDACLRLPISRAEEALGDERQAVYALPRAALEASKRRFEQVLQDTSDHLRQLASVALSARSQKRPATDDSLTGSPTSAKRLKLSVSPVSTEIIDDAEANGFHMSPPPSTSASLAMLCDAPPKPQVTIAMLRALAQGVLKSAK